MVGRAWVGAAAVLAAGLLAASGGGPASASPAVAEGAVRTALSTTGSATAAAATTSRLAGKNRIETAVLVSRRAFRSAFTSGGSVYLARSDVFADAVAAGTLTDGPILLVPTCGTAPPSVVDETARLKPARVVALGGTGAVCDGMLRAVAGNRSRARLAGATRYDTAIAIANERARQGAVTEVYVADGDDGPDAVVGGQLTRGPILLNSRHQDLTSKLKTAVDRLKPQRVVALGGSGVVPEWALDNVAAGRQRGRLGGSDRFDSSAAIAGREFPSEAPVVYLARSDVYADAVAAGSLLDGPLLLVSGCSLPAASRERIAYARPATVVALGGPSTVCDAVLQAATRATTASGGWNHAVDQDRTGWSSDGGVHDGLAISSDGRFVVFRGDASALMPPGSVPTGTSRALLLRDRVSGSLELVSVMSSGQPFPPQTSSAVGERISVSDDGRYVAFTTDQADPGLGDSNGLEDVYLRDRQSGTTRLVSGFAGVAKSGSWSQLTRDGRYVFFHSTGRFSTEEADNTSDVFRYSVADGTVVRVSTNLSGVAGDGGSYVPSPSDDGRYVAFQSVATNLVDGDTNLRGDVFVKDLQTGEVVRASVDDGLQGDGSSSIPSLSGDGNRLVFLSKAKNFGAAASSSDQVFLWQRGGGSLTWVSRTPSGAAFNQPNIAHLSGDGSTVVFDAYTRAGTYAPAEMPLLWRYEVGGGALAPISTTYAGTYGWSAFASSALSYDGRRVLHGGAWATSGSDLMADVVWEKAD